MYDLDWNLLKSFLAVVETGSLTAAARQLDASQPTLGRHVAELEAKMGTTLLRRTPRGQEATEAGAAFFQTQAVYDPAAFETFMKAAVRFDVPVLAGLIVLKSARMARNLNANLPGVHVPDSIIAEMDGADSRREKSTEISARLIREISPMCRGVHIMAIGWESRVPGILDASGVSSGG